MLSISLGEAQNASLADLVIEFEDGTVADYERFDERNLAACKHLNLRNSSFTGMEVRRLAGLEFIDIYNSKIKTIDLRGLPLLKKVVHDVTQEVIVNDGVDIDVQ